MGKQTRTAVLKYRLMLKTDWTVSSKGWRPQALDGRFTAIHLLASTKKSFSALERRRQLGHKRYQPIWEMMRGFRSVMGQRNDRYQLKNHRVT